MCIIQEKNLNIMNLLTKLKEKNKKGRIPFIFQQWKQKKDILK